MKIVIDLYTRHGVRLTESKLGIVHRLWTGNTASMQATPPGVLVVTQGGIRFLVPWSNIDQAVLGGES